MITLYDKLTDRRIGDISEGELQFLIDELEEESRTDQDYYIDAATIDFFVTRHATPHLVAILREALGLEEGIEIRWSDDSPEDSEYEESA